jgi:glycosyltransferase 2 family protein
VNRKSLFLLSLAVAAAIVAYRLSGWDFDWSLFFSSLWNVHPGWLVASIIATYATYVTRAFRWQILLNPLKPIPIGPLIIATVVGFSAIFVLGRPGELVRPLWIARREHTSLTASVATIIVERFFDSVMLILLFGWSLLFVHLPAAADATLRLMKDAAWVMLIGSVGAIIFMFFFRSNIDRIVRFIRFDRIGRLLRSFSQGLSFLQRGSSLGWILFHSFLTWVLITLQFWTMMLGMNFRFSLEAATLVMVGAALGSIAQVPGIGGGFQAGYVFCMTTFFQVPAEQAIATSLVAWVASYVPTVAMAGYYMISHGLSLKDLRTATAE